MMTVTLIPAEYTHGSPLGQHFGLALYSESVSQKSNLV